MNQEEVRFVKDNRKKPVDKKRTKVPEKSQNISASFFFPDISLSLRTALGRRTVAS